MSESSQPKNMMPVWLNDDHIDPKWLEEATGLSQVESCFVVDISNATRRAERIQDGATLRLQVTMQKNETSDDENEGKIMKTLIVKQVPDRGEALSQRLGLAREALFYSQLAGDLPIDQGGLLTPNIYYSRGNFVTGSKIVIMEDLGTDALDSGIFFGPGNPNNWTRDLPALIQKAGNSPPSSRDVALVTFRKIAEIHAIFWKRRDLLDEGKSWLRAQEWLQGKGRDSWEASQQLVRGCWDSYLKKEAESLSQQSDGDTTTTPACRMILDREWDPVLREAVEKAVDGISWEAQLRRLNANDDQSHWTLVHGDFWPGNVLWITGNNDGSSDEKKETRSTSGEIRFVDWEMVGLGSGPQDLGQYVLSNMDPLERKACERELVEAYYNELVSHGVTDCSWDHCWREYRVGGLERWIWFLVYFLGNGMYDWARFFHDQMATFMKDHGLTAKDVTQPRP